MNYLLAELDDANGTSFNYWTHIRSNSHELIINHKIEMISSGSLRFFISNHEHGAMVVCFTDFNVY